MEGGWADREVEQAASEPKERVDSTEEGGPREDLEEQRKRLCLDFASISNCGAAAAERYLAENGWDMQVGAVPSLSPFLHHDTGSPRLTTVRLVSVQS